MLRADKYLVVYQGTEGGDEVWGQMVEVVDMRDVSEEVFAYKFFLRAPDIVPVAVDDGVEVRVTLSSRDTRRCSKEVREEVKVDLEVHCPRAGPGPRGPRAGPARPPEGQGPGQRLCGPGPVWQGQGPD